MGLTKKVQDRIRVDRELRLKLALHLEVGEEAIKRANERQSRLITDYPSVKFLERYLELPETEVIDLAEQPESEKA